MNTLVGDLAEPSHSLTVVLRNSFPFVVLPPKVVLPPRKTLVGGFTMPLCGFCVVLWNAPALGICDAEIVLRQGDGLAMPAHRFIEILRYAFAFLVHHAEVVLRFRMALICGFAIPIHSLFVILRDASALGVVPSESGLRKGVSLFCLSHEAGDIVCFV